MKLIVGLGNPGRTYARHRHNVGFQCVEELARRQNLAFTRRQGKALVASGQVDSVPFLLAEPQTYMNASGEAVAHLLSFYKVDPADLLVVCDDLDLPLGKIRLRPSGGTGGHRGMQSIIGLLGRQDFPRLRIGIGRPTEGATDPDAIQPYVLSEFSAGERPVIEEVRLRAADAIHTFVVDGLERAMNRYNVDP